MSLTTFGGIKAAVADWIQRSDLTTVIANDFWTACQSKLYMGDTGNEPLRVQAMLSSATVTPGSDGSFSIASAISATWLEFRQLLPTYSGARPISYLSPWEYAIVAARADTAPPAYYYTVEGDSVKTYPASASTIAALWYQKFAAVSADGDTDWIILNAPQVYLSGLLAEACDYLDDPRAGTFRAKFAGGIAALNLKDNAAAAGASPRISRPRGVA